MVSARDGGTRSFTCQCYQQDAEVNFTLKNIPCPTYRPDRTPELKTFVIRYIVVTLRDSAAAGLPLWPPVVLFLSTF